MAYPLLALLLTHSPVFAGWVGAASTIPALLMHLPAGWLVDRFNRRILMIVSQSVRLVASLLLVCALSLEYQQTTMIIVAALCERTFLVLYNAAEITVIQRVVSSAKLPSALAVNEARSHLALMAGQPLGGFLFGLGKALPYIVNVLASMWSIFALSMMDKKNYQPCDADESSVGRPNHLRISFLWSVKRVILNPFLRTVVVVCAVGNFFFQIVVLLLVVLAEQQHLSSARIGLLLASSGVGGLAGSIIAPIVGKRVRDEQNVMLCVVAWAVLTFVVAVSAQPVAGLLAWGGLSITGGLLNVAIITHQAREVPEQMLGQVMSINRFLTSGAVPLGALSAGYIIVELNPHTAAWLVFFAIMTLVGVVPVLLYPRKLLPNRMVDRLKKWLAPPAVASPCPIEGIREKTPEPV